jgi:hypothetical protein
MPKGTDSHAKKKAIDDAMNWLRNNDQPADVDDPTAQGLANPTHARQASVSGGEGPWLRIHRSSQQRAEA